MNEVTETYTALVRRRRAWLLGLGVLVVAAFLAGLIPMWIRAHNRGADLREMRRTLRLEQLQLALGSAAIEARRGDYEPAREAASRFFSGLQDEANSGSDSALTAEERSKLGPIFKERDSLITLLARGDPASADRLSNLYMQYLKLMATHDAPPSR